MEKKLREGGCAFSGSTLGCATLTRSAAGGRHGEAGEILQWIGVVTEAAHCSRHEVEVART